MAVDLMCLDCGNVCESDELILIRENQGECHGFPCYETWLACPQCKSTELQEICLFYEEDEEKEEWPG